MLGYLSLPRAADREALVPLHVMVAGGAAVEQAGVMALAQSLRNMEREPRVVKNTITLCFE